MCARCLAQLLSIEPGTVKFQIRHSTPTPRMPTDRNNKINVLPRRNLRKREKILFPMLNIFFYILGGVMKQTIAMVT